MTRRNSGGTRAPGIQDQIDHLMAEDAELLAEISQLRARRRQLAARLRALRAHQSLSHDVRDGEMNDRNINLQIGSIADAAALLLGERGPTAASELVSILQEAGKLRYSEWAHNTLLNAFRRDPRFEHAPGRHGVWQLKPIGGH